MRPEFCTATNLFVSASIPLSKVRTIIKRDFDAFPAYAYYEEAEVRGSVIISIKPTTVTEILDEALINDILGCADDLAIIDDGCVVSIGSSQQPTITLTSAAIIHGKDIET